MPDRGLTPFPLRASAFALARFGSQPTDRFFGRVTRSGLTYVRNCARTGKFVCVCLCVCLWVDGIEVYVHALVGVWACGRVDGFARRTLNSLLPSK